MIDAELLADLRRLVNTLRSPEWQRDLEQAVPTDLVKQIAEDFRSYNPAPRSPLNTPPATANPVDAAPVKTGTDTVAGNGSGWAEAPKVDAWRPPGIDLIDRMVQTQDAIDRAAKIRELVEAAAVQRAEAEVKQEEQKERKGSKGPKEGE
jgi:hypothetical protein